MKDLFWYYFREYGWRLLRWLGPNWIAFLGCCVYCLIWIWVDNLIG